MSETGPAVPAGQAKVDFVAGVFLAAISAIALIWFIPANVDNAAQDFDVSPAFFPQITALSVLVLSLFLIGKTYRAWRGSAAANPLGGFVIEALLWLGLTVLTIAGLNWIGFWLTSALLMGLLGVMSRHPNLLVIAGLAVVFPFAVDQLAWIIFTVDMP